MIDIRYNQTLSHIFSTSVIRDLSQSSESESFNYAIRNSGILGGFNKSPTYKEIFEETYKYLLDNYRSEYVYKNAIAEKILLGRHSLNTACLLSEFRVADSKADIVILNGTTNVYEIKTEYDSTDKLERQICNYKKVFDKIYVVTHNKMVPKIESMVDEEIGILVLSEQYTLRCVREATSNIDRVDPEVIFESLRKEEYCKILKKEFGFVPDVPNTRLFLEAKKLFRNLRPQDAHANMLAVLKGRNRFGEFSNDIKSLPQSMIMALLSLPLSKNQIDSLNRSLNCVYH